MPDLQTHRRRYLILLLLLCPIAAFVLMPHPKDFSVEKRARRLVAVTDWYPTRLAGGLAYQWASRDQVVVMHLHGRVGLLNVSTGVEQPLDKLNQAFAARPWLRQLTSALPDWVISPDGKWILTATGVNGAPEWVAATLDGTRIVEQPTPSLANPIVFWQRDSRGFVQLFVGPGRCFGRRYVLDSGSSATSRREAIPIGRSPDDFDLGIPEYRTEAPFMPLGEFAPGRVLMANFGHRSGVQCLIYRLPGGRASTAAGGASVQRNRRLMPADADIQTPATAFVSEMEISPDGNRIGWVFNFVAPDVDPNLRRLPFVPVGPGHGSSEVWVSDRSGAHMHPIVTPGRSQSGPSNLRWTPDSKQVTFIYASALWAADAN